MGDQNKKDSRKAAIDLANWLGQDEPPTPSYVVKMFNIRYGFGLTKLRNLMVGYKDEWELNEKDNLFQKVL